MSNQGKVVSGVVADGEGVGNNGFGLNGTDQAVVSNYIARELDATSGVGVRSNDEINKILLSDGLILARTGVLCNGNMDVMRVTDHIIIGDGTVDSAGFDLIVSAGCGPMLIDGITAVDCGRAAILVSAAAPTTLSNWTIRNIQAINCGPVLSTSNITFDNTCVIELPGTGSVTAAATITLPFNGVVAVNGNTNITDINPSWPGRRVTLIFTGTPTLTDGNHLKLGGNFVATVDDAIDLVCDGSNWYQPAPGSAN